ncbi:hypothetical protein [Cardinium endosymbiont of Dermatophagoides farinae]|uniref:hypothetical protein n=1 Tax=Cardinium endosymbiont of Dermatophagoides farinae TaxID=2597823 RepID=UPI00118206D3|nr:hypothetical protein [Cardinium endosymbiont of Dermatophagoides farinae]TSJ80866.1 hypothetical protein FPG78_02300 [Cardinium endosymbiont of Dermatophagoides farinae]
MIGCTIRKQYHRNQTEIGMNLLYNHYDIPIIEKEKDPYYSQSVVSLFYRLLWKNLMLFGEAGLNGPTTAKKGKALITGCLISLSRYIDLASGLYYYGKGFYTPYGCGFKRYTTDHGNEKGGMPVCSLPLCPVGSSQRVVTFLLPCPLNHSWQQPVVGIAALHVRIIHGAVQPYSLCSIS